MHPLLGHGTKQTSTKYKLKSHTQIIIKHACERVLRYISVAGGGGGGGGAGGPPPNRNAPNDKNVKKRLLFLQFEFLSASSRTTLHAYSSN